MKTFRKKSINFLSGSLIALCCAAWLLFGFSASGWKALAVPTGSMRPNIPPGSMVFVHRVPIAGLQVGNIITFNNPQRPDTTLSHRIVKTYLINGKVPGFVTKGDANKTEDVPIAGGNVIGKVMWKIPAAGSWLINSKNPWVVLPIVYIAALLIMFEEIIRLRDYFRFITPYRVPGFARH
jgi:signal peptidase